MLTPSAHNKGKMVAIIGGGNSAAIAYNVARTIVGTKVIIVDDPKIDNSTFFIEPNIDFEKELSIIGNKVYSKPQTRRERRKKERQNK